MILFYCLLPGHHITEITQLGEWVVRNGDVAVTSVGELATLENWRSPLRLHTQLHESLCVHLHACVCVCLALLLRERCVGVFVWLCC